MFFELIFQSLHKIVVVLAIITFSLIKYRLWWKKVKLKLPPKVPGPPSIPFFGTRWILYFHGYRLSKIHEFYDDMYRRYGPIVKEEVLFNVPVYNIFEKCDIEKVLKASSKYPIRPPMEPVVIYRNSRPDRYASAGLVNEQGEKWHFLRTTLTSELTSPKTIQNFQNEAYNLSEDWCTYLKSKKRTDGFIENINDLVVHLCIETVGALVLGRRLGFLCPNTISQKSLKLAEALQKYFAGLRDVQFSLPWWKYFETAPYRTMTQCENYIYETVLEMIKEYAEETNEGTVYGSILNANIDEREKTAAIIDFIAAGIHTLKNSLIFLFYLVAKHPEKQEKIATDLTYAKACMTESFRLLPTATPLARILEEDMKISGYQIKAGSVVSCHNAVACRSSDNFSLAAEFIPERWLGEARHKSISAGTFLVTPFGTGRRICPGKRFIEQVLPIFLQQTVKAFDMRTDHVLELQFEFLRAPKGCVSLTLKDRD